MNVDFFTTIKNSVFSSEMPTDEATNVGDLLWLNSTQAITAMVFIIVASIITIFIIKKFSLNKATIFSFF